MLRKAELGELAVDFPHDPVARHLGDDAGRGDRERARVALHQGVVGKWKPGHRQAVDEAMTGHTVETLRRACHGEVRRLEDVEAVYFTAIGQCHPPADLGMAEKKLVQRLAP